MLPHILTKRMSQILFSFVTESLLSFSGAGVVGYANSGKNSNTSQFYMTLAPAPKCDGKHVVIGEVVEGLDILKRIGASSHPPSLPDLSLSFRKSTCYYFVQIGLAPTVPNAACSECVWTVPLNGWFPALDNILLHTSALCPALLASSSRFFFVLSCLTGLIDSQLQSALHRCGGGGCVKVT
jgi:Cyclophilin type peptidyl-prolyl cis-trans isomerase/CLD